GLVGWGGGGDGRHSGWRGGLFDGGRGRHRRKVDDKWAGTPGGRRRVSPTKHRRCNSPVHKQHDPGAEGPVPQIRLVRGRKCRHGLGACSRATNLNSREAAARKKFISSTHSPYGTVFFARKEMAYC